MENKFYYKWIGHKKIIAGFENEFHIEFEVADYRGTYARGTYPIKDDNSIWVMMPAIEAYDQIEGTSSYKWSWEDEDKRKKLVEFMNEYAEEWWEGNDVEDNENITYEEALELEICLWIKTPRKPEDIFTRNKDGKNILETMGYYESDIRNFVIKVVGYAYAMKKANGNIMSDPSFKMWNDIVQIINLREFRSKYDIKK